MYKIPYSHIPDYSGLETRRIRIPFRSYERCARVFSDFCLEWTLNSILLCLDEKRPIKRRMPHHRMWLGHEDELRLYYWYCLQEWKRRGLRLKHVEIDWSVTDGAPWHKDKLFYISQKVLCLRENLRVFIPHFYVLSLKQWPSGGYYPFKHINNAQREVNEAWLDVFNHNFDGKLRNVGVVVSTGKGLIEKPEKKLFLVGDKLWKKKQKERMKLRLPKYKLKQLGLIK